MTTALLLPPARAEGSQIPFGTRAERVPFTINVKAGAFAYDLQRQVNLTPSGELWAQSDIPGSCTNTNWDSTNDDTADPYVVG